MRMGRCRFGELLLLLAPVRTGLDSRPQVLLDACEWGSLFRRARGTCRGALHTLHSFTRDIALHIITEEGKRQSSKVVQSNSLHCRQK